MQLFFFNTPCRLAMVQTFFGHPTDFTWCKHGADIIYDTVQTYMMQTFLSHPADETCCRHSPCRQKHPADKNILQTIILQTFFDRRYLMSVQTIKNVCTKIMSAGCFGSCDSPPTPPSPAQVRAFDGFCHKIKHKKGVKKKVQVFVLT